MPGPATPDPAALVGRARQIRRAAGVGFREMALDAGVHRSTLSVWERDPLLGLAADPARRSPQAEHWVAVLAVLDAASGYELPAGGNPLFWLPAQAEVLSLDARREARKREQPQRRKRRAGNVGIAFRAIDQIGAAVLRR